MFLNLIRVRIYSKHFLSKIMLNRSNVTMNAKTLRAHCADHFVKCILFKLSKIEPNEMTLDITQCSASRRHKGDAAESDRNLLCWEIDFASATHLPSSTRDENQSSKD